MEQNVKKTGTTTVGMKYSDGVVIASDQKATMGDLVESKRVRKIFKITDRMGMTVAGSVGDVQALVRLLRAELKIYELERRKPISVKAAAVLLSNVLQGNKFYPYMGMFILGGHDDRGPQVFSLDPLGGLDSEEDYYASGSGMPYALGVLEDQYKPKMGKDEAIKIVLRSIRSAKERDVNSGGIGYWLAVIDKDGYKEFSEEEIRKYTK